MNTNVRGVLVQKYEMQAMLQGSGGSIVNCASVGAHRATRASPSTTRPRRPSPR